MSPALKEQLRLRRLDNDTLFKTYINELRLRNLSPYYIKKVWELLRVYKEYLKDEQLTPQLAKMFLSQYVDRKQNTIVRYYTYVNSFMTWFGAGLDYKPKPPHNVPPYHTKQEINSLVKATKGKKTHKKLARRDALIIELATTTGMRRSELANLLVGDVSFPADSGMIFNHLAFTRGTEVGKKILQLWEGRLALGSAYPTTVGILIGVYVSDMLLGITTPLEEWGKS